MARRAGASQGLTRRRFVALLAGGALASAAPVPAAPRKRRTSTVPAARDAAIERSIAQQKALLAQQLKTLREYPLPPGSDPAFVFKPVAPRRIR